MKKIIILALAMLSAALVSGCSSLKAQYSGNKPLESMKSAYVVVETGGNPNIGRYILTALARHNLKVDIGTIKNKPADVSFYVTYEDHWSWDLAVYLSSLDVQFVDNTTGQMIASGSFRNNPVFETFPDPRTKTCEVVDSICAKSGN